MKNKQERTSILASGGMMLKSPVEFVLVGPLEGRDRVLLRSPEAGLDLIGLAAENPRSMWHSKPDPFSLFFSDSKQLNIVSSFPLADLDPESDARQSTFSFAWKGYSSSGALERVKDTLNLHAPDLHRGIKNQDTSEVEWALAPVIYQCIQVNERRLRLRRMLWLVLVLYAGVAMLAAIGGLLSQLDKFWLR